MVFHVTLSPIPLFVFIVFSVVVIRIASFKRLLYQFCSNSLMLLSFHRISWSINSIICRAITFLLLPVCAL